MPKTGIKLVRSFSCGSPVLHSRPTDWLPASYVCICCHHPSPGCLSLFDNTQRLKGVMPKESRRHNCIWKTQPFPSNRSMWAVFHSALIFPFSRCGDFTQNDFDSVFFSRPRFVPDRLDASKKIFVLITLLALGTSHTTDPSRGSLSKPVRTKIEENRLQG
jgi:hypothetical protein